MPPVMFILSLCYPYTVPTNIVLVILSVANMKVRFAYWWWIVILRSSQEGNVASGRMIQVCIDAAESSRTDTVTNEDPIDTDPIDPIANCQRNDVYQIKTGKLAITVIILGFLFIWSPCK